MNIPNVPNEIKYKPSDHQTLKCNVRFQQTAWRELDDYQVESEVRFHFHITNKEAGVEHFLHEKQKESI